MIATLAVTGTIGVAAAAAVESAGAGADGVWANAPQVDARVPTPVADASRQTSVNERFIGIQNSF
jgi:hypothetical protein